jgi:hypothetical protein
MGTRPDLAARNYKHGHAVRRGETREFRSWRGMIERCENPNHVGFKYYGARGVKVCARWRESFAAFLADMGARPKGKSLDRLDPNGDYAADNCRWPTASAQRKNQREQDDRARVLAGWETRRARGWQARRDDRGRFS